MPSRLVVAKELAEVFKVLAHRDRIRIVEILRVREFDVNSISDELDLPATRISQHLSLMRAHRLVEERRDGRHVYYSLAQPDLAHWIVDGLQFVEARAAADQIKPQTVDEVRKLWVSETLTTDSPTAAPESGVADPALPNTETGPSK
ncbi:MAG: metalloregulator ArsR/SmtB family transcription factor [Pseudomonadota bacterium]